WPLVDHGCGEVADGVTTEHAKGTRAKREHVIDAVLVHIDIRHPRPAEVGTLEREEPDAVVREDRDGRSGLDHDVEVAVVVEIRETRAVDGRPRWIGEQVA